MLARLSIVTLVLFSVSNANGQSATAKEVIDRAIKAQAEKPDDLAKQRVERILMEGTINLGEDVPSVRELLAEWPNRLRYNITLKKPQGESKIFLTLNGDRGWRVGSELPFYEYDLNEIDEFRGEAHGRWVATLYPLLNGKFTLTALPDNRVEDELVQVVRVAAKYRPDVTLYFSKKTGLLVKASYKTTENGTPVRKEHYFSDYKKFDGLLLPSKTSDWYNGNPKASYTIKEYKFLDKQPAGTWEKPNDK